MSNLSIHFSYEPPDQNRAGTVQVANFAQTLINDFGQVDFDDADTVITVGGDGSLLHAFGHACKGQRFFGLVPPSSNSRGFWTNHGIKDSQMLDDALNAAEGFKINPLKAEITFADKSTRLVHAFNEVWPSENSGQSMLAHLTIEYPNTTIGPLRMMGDGLIIATPFGSTAANSAYDGSKVNIRNNVLVMTGQGLTVQAPDDAGKRDPVRFSPVVEPDDTIVHLDFSSSDKRPVRLKYDGKVIASDTHNPFSKLIIEKAHDRDVELLLMDDPATRVHSSYIKIPSVI